MALPKALIAWDLAKRLINVVDDAIVDEALDYVLDKFEKNIIEKQGHMASSSKILMVCGLVRQYLNLPDDDMYNWQSAKDGTIPEKK
jgi:hypothetical protein